MRFGKNVWKHLEGTLWILSEQEGEKKFAGAPESSSCNAFSKSPPKPATEKLDFSVRW